MGLFVNEDWSALVPAGSPQARFGITPKDAKRRGLLPLDEPLEELETISSANVKQADPSANKAAPKPANKGAARKEPVDGDSD